ncbi:MAG: S8 family serine peptidase [Candidatus Methylomirabilis oxyfera]|nr:S8 family serine peptidase [Candidatus Methylomirabilis oxyfera]
MKAFRVSALQVVFLLSLALPCLAGTPFKHPKMSSAIVDAVGSGRLQTELSLNQSLGSSMSLSEEGLQVYIEMEEVSEATLTGLRGVGVTIELTDPDQRLVQARIPLAKLDAVAALPSVKFIRLPDYGFTNRQGSVGTEGNATVRANMLRLQSGVSGAGVRVGVISGGVSGLAQSIATGNLPPTNFFRDNRGILIATTGGVTAQSFRADGNLEVFGNSPDAEGTALLEIVHDIAPGSQLFYANFGTGLEFNQAVNFLAAHTDIVVDDVNFFNAGPYDGTSSVSQNTTNALNNPSNPIRAYFTVAANYRMQHYRGTFSNAGGSFPSINGIEGGVSNAHLFTATAGTTGPAPQISNEITVPPGGASIYLQWDDPFGASANDYDLFVLQSDGSIVTGSVNAQTGFQNPIEAVFIPNTGSAPVTLSYSIVNFRNQAAPRTFDVFLATTSAVAPVIHQFNTPGMSIPNQADAGGGVLTVGAVPWLFPNVPEPYGGEGTTRDGRLKPEVMAPDGVSVSGAGGFSQVFFGTSAASPHAAGAAALLLSQNLGLTRSQLADLLKGTAVDLGPPGPDNRFGFGRIDAFPTAPHGMVTLDRPLYRTGDTLSLSASLQPGSALNTGDAYVFAALPPDGSTLFSIVPSMGGGFTGTLGLQPLALGFPVPSFSGEFFEYTFSGAEPPGFYSVFGVVAHPGQSPLPLDADRLDQTTIFGGTVFVFSP